MREVTNAELAAHIVQAMVRVATGQEGDVMVPQKLREEMAHNSLVRLQNLIMRHEWWCTLF